MKHIVEPLFVYLVQYCFYYFTPSASGTPSKSHYIVACYKHWHKNNKLRLGRGQEYIKHKYIRMNLPINHRENNNFNK